jgi:hypothetical protein
MSKITDSVHGSMRSGLAWLLVGLHAVWFFIAIVRMGPPNPALGYTNAGPWDLRVSDASLVAGRAFHFEYEPLSVMPVTPMRSGQVP